MDIDKTKAFVIKGLSNYHGVGGFFKKDLSNFSTCKELGVDFFISNGNSCLIVAPARMTNENGNCLEQVKSLYLPIDWTKLFDVTYNGRQYEVFEITPSSNYKLPNEELTFRYIGDFICFVAKYLFEGNFNGKLLGYLDSQYLLKYTNCLKTALIYRYLLTNCKNHLNNGSMDGISYKVFGVILSGLFAFIRNNFRQKQFQPIVDKLIKKHVVTICATKKEYLNDIKLICKSVTSLVNSLKLGIKKLPEYPLEFWALDPQIEFKVVERDEFMYECRYFYDELGMYKISDNLAYKLPTK